MNVWERVALSAIYTISPTHCGTGQAEGAVDLPIAREAHTRYPLLPSTSLKGVARDALTKAGLEKAIDDLFGPRADQGEELRPGALAFTDGRLLAYPARSLSRPFVHVSCPAILQVLARDLRALHVEKFLPNAWKAKDPGAGAVVADKALVGKTLIIEDLAYAASEVHLDPGLETLANALGDLLGKGEADTAARLKGGLVLIPDADFSTLMDRLPVRARIQLTDGKTTSAWTDPQGKEHSGNLWYEEYLPPECLFLSFVGQRRVPSAAASDKDTALGRFLKKRDALAVVQIGGNETVGQGLCLWSFDQGGAS